MGTANKTKMSKKRQVPFLLRVVRWWFPKLEIVAPPLATRLFEQLFFSPLNYDLPAKEFEWIKKTDGFELHINGKRIQCYSWGNIAHPVILFVHGWAGRGTQFRKFFPVFMEAGFRIVSFDGPAHGKSEGRQTNIVEFGDVLKEIIGRVGAPRAIVAHSFGGIVALLGATQGLPVKKIINIGSPVIGDKIIETFLTAVNGKWSTGEKFKAHMFKKYNRSFDEFSSEYFIRHLKTPLDLMLVHDAQDKDVSMEHPERLIELYPPAFLYRTSGLGHTRILKDESVIKDCLKFVQSV
jgi:pimeloyl-ACP methyl ester carboxylesterase